MVEPTDIYDVEEILYVQEVQLEFFYQELATPSATANVAHAIISQNPSDNGNSSTHKHFYGRAWSTRGRGYGKQVYITCC